MSVDDRTRYAKDVRSLERDEMLDGFLPDALAVHGDLAGRGCSYLDLPALGFDVDGRAVTLAAVSGTLRLVPGIDSAGVVAVLGSDALSDLLQDQQSTMGLAMTSRVKITAADIGYWIGWEPVLRALLDGRKVHEAGDVTLLDLDGDDLDLGRAFTVDDDPAEMAHFLEQAGFLHLRDVFGETDMATLGADVQNGWPGRLPTTASRGGPPTRPVMTTPSGCSSSTKSRLYCARCSTTGATT